METITPDKANSEDRALALIELTRSGATTRKPNRFAEHTDRAYNWLLFTVAAVVFLLIVAIVWEVYSQSRLSIHHFGLKFFTGKEWDPVDEIFSIRVFALGTLYTSFLALLIAIPISVGSAVYLAEVAPRWLRTPLAFLIELLAAIPSVVYGLWGIFVLVPWLLKHVETPLGDNSHLNSFFLFNAPPNGNDFLAASLVLAIMIIPIITGVARDILRAVPKSTREASYALGATKWETIRRVVLPYARGGIIGSVILGLGRALGETMAVTMVIGNSPDFKLALFSPGYTMSSVIANEFSEAPLELYRSALMEVGLSLLVIAIVVNSCARLLVYFTAKNLQGGRYA